MPSASFPHRPHYCKCLPHRFRIVRTPVIAFRTVSTSSALQADASAIPFAPSALQEDASAIPFVSSALKIDASATLPHLPQQSSTELLWVLVPVQEQNVKHMQCERYMPL
ncbi:MAG: hypothetical protein HY841_13150 [Bacteroidetes bacterium]|nr:hypothetical protein [Bacteroidota bacterium]